MYELTLPLLSQFVLQVHQTLVDVQPQNILEIRSWFFPTIMKCSQTSFKLVLPVGIVSH